MGTPVVSTEVHNELGELAKKHGKFETYAQDLLRLAEHIWHNRHREEGAIEELATDTETDETTPVEVTGTAAPVTEPVDAEVKTEGESDTPAS